MGLTGGLASNGLGPGGTPAGGVELTSHKNAVGGYPGLDAGGLLLFQQPIKALTYSASVTPNLADGPWQTLAATNGSALTVNAPTNPPAATATAELTIEVTNSSGGTMGTVTWDTAFVFATGAFTKPADTKKRFVRFEWNGTKWVCTSLASADY